MYKSMLTAEAFEEQTASKDTNTDPKSSNSDSVEKGDKKLSETYSDGTGTKDLIVMTGPLSEIYTKALGVYFAKKPIEGDGDDIDGETIDATPSTESQANDAIMAAAVSEVATHQASIAPVGSRVRLVSQYTDFDEEPNVNVMVVPAEGATSPQVVTAINHATNQARDNSRDMVVMVTTVAPNDYLTPTFDDGLNMFNITGDFENDTDSAIDEKDENMLGATVASVERMTIKYNRKTVVAGVEGFAAWLVKKYG